MQLKVTVSSVRVVRCKTQAFRQDWCFKVIDCAIGVCTGGRSYLPAANVTVLPSPLDSEHAWPDYSPHYALILRAYRITCAPGVLTLNPWNLAWSAWVRQVYLGLVVEVSVQSRSRGGPAHAAMRVS